MILLSIISLRFYIFDLSLYISLSTTKNIHHRGTEDTEIIIFYFFLRGEKTKTNLVEKILRRKIAELIFPCRPLTGREKNDLSVLSVPLW